MNKEERKLERRFNAWVDSHEKELRILMANPNKWEFVEECFFPQTGPQDTPKIPLYDASLLLKMACQPDEKAPEPETP